jgi:hypothetical protein
MAKTVVDLTLDFTESPSLNLGEEAPEIEIPLASGQDGDDFSVALGWHLTAEQLAYNRARAAGG